MIYILARLGVAIILLIVVVGWVVYQAAQLAAEAVEAYHNWRSLETP